MKRHSLLCAIESFLERDLERGVNVVPIESEVCLVGLLVVCLSVLLLGLTPLGPTLPTGEELFIDMLKPLLEPALSALLLSSLCLLTLLVFSSCLVHVREGLVTVHVLIIFGSAVLVYQC